MLKLSHYYQNLNGIILQLNSDGSSSPYNSFNRRSRRLALIDRDGVIIRKAPRHQYITKQEDVVLLDGVTEAIKYLNEREIPTIVHNNAPSIYKGLLTMKEYYEINLRLGEALERRGAILDAVIFCPHPAPTEGDNVKSVECCNCRKPAPGMLNLGLKLYDADETQTIAFGDFESDIQAAKNAGVIPAYVATRHDEYDEVRKKIREIHPDVFYNSTFASLLEAVKLFERLNV